MGFLSSFGAAVISFAFWSPVAIAQIDSAEMIPGFEKTDCFIVGSKNRATCATLQVPLYHAVPDGEKIETFAAVLPALSGKPEADPMVVFAGGPGQAATEILEALSAPLEEIWQDRDIVLIDQRGTGRSTPLDCPITEISYSPELLKKWIVDCFAGVDVDTRAFNLAESVHDIAAMLKALGYEKVNTYGVSYGTRTSAYFLKTYPEMIRSMIVDAIAPPDYTLFETGAKAAENAFSALEADCNAVPDCQQRFPDLRAQLDEFLARARAGDLRYVGPNPITGEPLDVPIDEVGAVESVRSVLYSVPGTGFLPYAISEAAKGNVTVLLNQSFAIREMGKMYFGMTLSYLCGEDVDLISPDEASQWGKGSFAADSFYRYFARNCENWQYLPASDYPSNMREPWAGDLPVLILSGVHDPITPPSGGDHIAKGLTNARHIKVPGTGHGTFGTACVPYLMTQFVKNLDGEGLDASCTDRVKRPPVILGPNGSTKLVSVPSASR